MKILAIETSCDETAIAIADFLGGRTRTRIRILSHLVSSQVKLHAQYGGVVPNLAKREHQRLLVPLLMRALKGTSSEESRIKNHELRKIKKKFSQNFDSRFVILNSLLEREPELLAQVQKKIIPLVVPLIDAIAVTYGPGLAPALWVGVNFARALATLWKKPLIPVNHMEGHLWGGLLEKRLRREDVFTLPRIQFPLLVLLVSGGHTELVLVRAHGNYEIIGETLDDAAGEAFDKTARLLGLGYPGGPEISRLAESGITNQESRIKIQLPRPMLRSNDYDFSFSGLKTAVLYLVRDLGGGRVKKLRPVIAKEFQDAVVDVLVAKTLRAARQYKCKTVAIGGGVAANKLLRMRLQEVIMREMPKTKLLLPSPSLTGDNALMIALAAYLTGKKKTPSEVGADANVRLSEIV